MEKILVSACLLGEKTRYDGGDNYSAFIEKLKEHYDIVPFCPEVEAGLGIPRLPCEIVKNRVLDSEGNDKTAAYRSVAEKAVNLSKFLGISIAILKDGSPACGPRKIHDGSFKGNKIPGMGITAQALASAGVKVYAETDALEFLIPEASESGRTGPYKANLDTKKKKFAKKKFFRKKDTGEEKKPFEKKEEASSGKRPYRKKFGDRKPYKKYGSKPSGRNNYRKRSYRKVDRKE